MALYVEFAFEGAIVANNLIDGGNGGISFANFIEHGGRLGVCSGNIVRNIRGGPTYPDGNLQIGAGIARGGRRGDHRQRRRGRGAGACSSAGGPTSAT